MVGTHAGLAPGGEIRSTRGARQWRPLENTDLRMSSTDGKPSRRGAIIGLLFFVIGVPLAVWLLFLLL